METIKETENTGFTLGKTFYKKNILVVNSLESKKAAVFNTAGHFNDSLCFIYGDKTTASESCSVTFKNKFYIFGGAFRTYGNNEQTQLSVLNGNQLTRIDNLRFNLKDRFHQTRFFRLLLKPFKSLELVLMLTINVSIFVLTTQLQMEDVLVDTLRK